MNLNKKKLKGWGETALVLLGKVTAKIILICCVIIILVLLPMMIGVLPYFIATCCSVVGIIFFLGLSLDSLLLGSLDPSENIRLGIATSILIVLGLFWYLEIWEFLGIWKNYCFSFYDYVIAFINLALGRNK